MLGHNFNDFLAGTMVAPSTAALHWYLQNLETFAVSMYCARRTLSLLGPISPCAFQYLPCLPFLHAIFSQGPVTLTESKAVLQAAGNALFDPRGCSIPTGTLTLYSPASRVSVRKFYFQRS